MHDQLNYFLEFQTVEDTKYYCLSEKHRLKSLLVLQNFTIQEKAGTFFKHTESFIVRHSSEYEISDND